MSLRGLVPLTLQPTAQPAPVSAPSKITPKYATSGIKAVPSTVVERILNPLPAQQSIHHLYRVNDGYLDLSGLLNLSDSDLKIILDKTSGTHITSINLSNCKNITDASLAHLVTLTLLSSLNLRGCYKITDAGLAHLSKLTLLSSLNLRGCYKITDAGLAHLSKLTLLSSLNLRGCYKITDAGLAYLETLRSLNLDNSGITLDAAKAFTGIKTIPSTVFERILTPLPAQQSVHHVYCVNDGCLDLSGLPNLSDSDLKIILDKTSGTHITSINLSNCKNITDAGLAHLVTLTLLSSLNLSKCKNITDAGLAHLVPLTLLSSLDLSFCENITDAGFDPLSKLTSLRSLNLSGCMITLAAALKAFKA